MQGQQFRFGYALAAIVAGAALLAPPVGAAEDVAAVVAKRQAAMKALGASVKTVSEYAQGKADQAAAIAASQKIQEIGKTVPSLFPPHTGLEELPGKSGAKPEIWSDPQKFKDAAAALASGSDALAKVVAAGDVASTGASLKALGHDACGTCHDTYRVKI